MRQFIQVKEGVVTSVIFGIKRPDGFIETDIEEVEVGKEYIAKHDGEMIE